MRFLHISDLHIGKRVNELSMLADQEFVLKQILRMVDDQQPHAVVIAGDVYDKTIPPAEAVTVFDDFLWSLSRRKVPVLIISGNHDSPERLAFGGRMLESAGIHLSPVYGGEVTPVTLKDESGEVDFWLLPFIKPIHVRRFFPEEAVESYTDALRTAIAHMPLDPKRRNVLVTHQFVTGSVTCESEEISVGGTDNVDAAVFEAFDYVALGHIHGPQNIGSNRIRYCGTPLKYSISEVGHSKSVTMVELAGDGGVKLTALPLQPLHDMRQLRGDFAALTEPSAWENTATEDYVHIILTDEEDVPEAVGRLRAIYPNMMKLSYDNTRTRSDQMQESAAVPERSPLELFDDLYRLVNNQPMSEVQRQFAAELIENIREGRL